MFKFIKNCFGINKQQDEIDLSSKSSRELLEDLVKKVDKINKKIDNTNAAVLIFAAKIVDKPVRFEGSVNNLTKYLNEQDYENIPTEAYKKAVERYRPDNEQRPQ